MRTLPALAAAAVALAVVAGCAPPVAPAPAGAQGACPKETVDALPARLSETGVDSPCARAFAPRFVLWSDGAEKSRHVYLPDDAVIDDTDVDHWEMPVGTRLWKQFTKDGLVVETRLWWRMEGGWQGASYVWDDDGKDATRNDSGVDNVRGTAHDTPGGFACTMCHGEGQSTRPLGFSAVQLAHDGDGLTVQALLDEGRLTHTPAQLPIPGDALDQQVLGWFHVNCGSCHRYGGYAHEVEGVAMKLALEGARLASVQETPAFQTTVGQPSVTGVLPDVGTLITPGDPAHSLVFVRDSSRGDYLQMPPLGTEIVDPVGIEHLRQWIQRLSP